MTVLVLDTRSCRWSKDGAARFPQATQANTCPAPSRPCSPYSTSSRWNTICSAASARRSAGSASSAARSIGQALVAAARTVEGRAVHSLHAYFMLPGDPDGADPLRGRPHPRRQELHHPPGGRHPARPGDLLHVGLVPDRGSRSRPSDCRCRRCRRRRNCRAKPTLQRLYLDGAPEPVRRYWERDAPDRAPPGGSPPLSQPRTAATRARTSGSAPPASCPTTPTSTAACSPTPPT